MSAKLTGMVFDRYPEGGGELILALKLADNAHDDGTHIFPSIDTMADKTRQSRRAVQYQLKRMRESGWLILVKAARGGREGAGRPAEYRINPEWIKGADFASLKLSTEGAKIAPIPVEKGATDDKKGCKTKQKRVQNGAEKGAKLLHTNHQLTVIEPSVNPAQARDDEQPPPGEQETEPDAAFDRWWATWPADSGRKQAREKCLARWRADELDAHVELIIAHTAAMKMTRHWKTGGDPTPLTYLTEKRWTDTTVAELAAAAATASDDGVPWYEGPAETIDAYGAQHGVRPRGKDEAIAWYRVLVAKAARDKSAIDFVLKDAKRFNSPQLFQFAVAEFGDALLPPDF